MSRRDAAADGRVEIDALTGAFFASFSNIHGPADVRGVYFLCLMEAVIAKATGDAPEIYRIDQFIEPRFDLLNGGALTNFTEHETSNETFIAGSIAQRRSTYTKSGVLAGQPFTATGTKLFQFVKMEDGWKISAVAWEDDPSALRSDNA